MTSELYCISKYNHGSSSEAEYTSIPWYEGQLVLAGPDAAIEVKDGMLTGYVGGVQSHPQGQFAQIIENYELAIRRQVSMLERPETSAIVLAGKWHHVDPEAEPRFEGYLVHALGREGAVATSRYTLDIFEWDDPALNNGSGFFGGGGKAAGETAVELQGHAELKLGPGKCSAANGMHAVEGVLWFPRDKGHLPIVYSNVNGPDAPARSVDLEEGDDANEAYVQRGDGTVLGELRARSRLLAGAIGEFRGEIVDRKSHRPEEMTLKECFASTDALGYWLQTQKGDEEPETVFRFPRGSRWEDEVLLQVNAADDQWAYGSAYASPWRPLSASMPNYRIRLLAVGTIPAVSAEPL